VFGVALFFFSLVDFFVLAQVEVVLVGCSSFPSVLVQQPQQCSAGHKAEPKLAAHATKGASADRLGLWRLAAAQGKASRAQQLRGEGGSRMHGTRMAPRGDSSSSERC